VGPVSHRELNRKKTQKFAVSGVYVNCVDFSDRFDFEILFVKCVFTKLL